MLNVLVTGANGFLASKLIERINKEQPDVNIYGVVKNKPSIKNSYLLQNPELVQSINLIEGDITDYSLMEQTVVNYEIDTIVHLASNAIVRTCEQNPLDALLTNVYGAAIFNEIARTNRIVKHVISMASDKSYGTSESLPYIEDVTPLRGMRAYESTKTLMDMWSQMYQHNYKTPVSIIRSANLFGPGDSNYSRLVPQVCMSIANDINPWLWEGVADYIREFVYIDDATDFILNLIDAGESDPTLIPQCYNLGTGNIFSIKDLVERIIYITGKDLQVDIKKKTIDFKEIEKQYLSLDKSRDLLGWEAIYIGESFDTALSETYEYYHWINEEFNK